MFGADGRTSAAVSGPHYQPEMSHYVGHPVINYSSRKKKKPTTASRGKKDKYPVYAPGKKWKDYENSVREYNAKLQKLHGFPAYYYPALVTPAPHGTEKQDDDQYRSMYVGEPFMLLPRSNGGSRVQHHAATVYYAPILPAYAYPMMNYPDYSIHGTPHQQIPLNATHHHRDSFSSSDSASSGSASPVHFSYWDTLNNPEQHDAQGNGPTREWIHKSPQELPEVNLGICMRIMSYNILSDQYASKKIHSYCPSWALSWSYRKEKIREDIELHAPDIACLQEVATGEFYQYFLDSLRAQGYEGIFSPKSRANTMDSVNRQAVDGCAVIYRSDRFELMHQHLVEFNQLAIKNADGSNDMINRVMTKDNIALCAVLRVIESTTPCYVLVVNAHVHWDPEYSDVKLIQTMLLMSEVKKLVEKVKLELAVDHVPLIFCGDLNSLPDSGVVDFITNGRVSMEHPEFRDLPYRSCLQKLNSQDNVTPQGYFVHPFALESTYSDENLPFTNFTREFKGVIDYIFVSKEKIQTLAVLGPINNAWMDDNKPVGFPSAGVPSDHLPLVADIELIV